MDTIRFEKPELDFDDKFASTWGRMVRLTVKAWHGDTMYAVDNMVSADQVGGPNWPLILRDMHLDLTRHIYERNVPKHFTIRNKR